MARSDGTPAPSENPFSAHRILPGTIPYLFSADDSSTDEDQLDRLIDAWQASGYLGQIVGPHGCGKTSLAHAIAKRAVESGSHPFGSVNSLIIRSRSLIRPDSAPSWLARLLRLHTTGVTVGASDCFGSIPSLTHQVEQSGSCSQLKPILVIDGIERLTLTQQALTLHSLKRQRIPALLTTHRVSKRLRFVGARCPVLFHAKSDIRVFTKIVNLMTADSKRIDPAVVEASFEASGGNVRDALMTLYDVFESNR